MAIASMHIKIISRARGQSALASAAYDSSSQVRRLDGTLTHDYGKERQDLVHSQIMLPPNAPKAYQDRQTLWQSVEAAEKSGRAQLAREVMLALPRELDRQEQIQLCQDFCQKNFINKGMCADLNIHDKGDGNPHAHIKLTLRSIDENGNWEQKKKHEYVLDENGGRVPEIDPKTGEQKRQKNGAKIWKRTTAETNNWNDLGNAEKWRHAAETEINFYLKDKNIKVDFRSYERQGTGRIPTRHEGPQALNLQRQFDLEGHGQLTQIHRENLEIRQLQKEPLQQLATVEEEKARLQREIADAETLEKRTRGKIRRLEKDLERADRIRHHREERQTTLLSKITGGALGGLTQEELDYQDRMDRYLIEGKKTLNEMDPSEKRQFEARLKLEKIDKELAKENLSLDRKIELKKERIKAAVAALPEEKYQAELQRQERLQQAKQAAAAKARAERAKTEKARLIAELEAAAKAKAQERATNTKARSTEALAKLKGRDRNRSRDKGWSLGR